LREIEQSIMVVPAGDRIHGWWAVSPIVRLQRTPDLGMARKNGFSTKEESSEKNILSFLPGCDGGPGRAGVKGLR
jgi:hypothetical protein